MLDDTEYGVIIIVFSLLLSLARVPYILGASKTMILKGRSPTSLGVQRKRKEQEARGKREDERCKMQSFFLGNLDNS